MSFGNNKPHSQKCSANFVNELQEKDFVVVETVFCKAGGSGAIIVFHFHKSRVCVCVRTSSTAVVMFYVLGRVWDECKGVLMLKSDQLRTSESFARSTTTDAEGVGENFHHIRVE